MVAESVLKEVVKRLVEQFEPIRIILFGSQARSTADDRSDVDRLVDIARLAACELARPSRISSGDP